MLVTKQPSANPTSGFAKGELTRGTTLFHRKFPALHLRRSSGLICAFNGAVRERLLPGPFQDSQAFWAFRLRSYLPLTPIPDCLSACGQSSLREAAVYSSSSQPFSILPIISVYRAFVKIIPVTVELFEQNNAVMMLP